MTPAGPRTRRRLPRFARRLVATGVAAGMTVLLAQSTTTAAFTATTGDTANQVTTAATFCTTPGTDTVTAGEDAVSNGTAGQTTTTNGSSTTMPVGISATAAGYAYIRFDLTGAPARTRCTVTGATLTLNAGTAQAATMDVFRAASSWSAATLTWANQPAYTGDAASLTVSGVAGEHAFGVRDHVRAFYAGSNYGFVVKDQANTSSSTRYQVYDSFNHGTSTRRPKLTITWG